MEPKASPQNQGVLRSMAWVLIGLIPLSLFYLSQVAYLADSEIWSLTISNTPLGLAQNEVSGWRGIGQALKLVHSSYIKIGHVWPERDFSYYQWQRALAALVGVGLGLLAWFSAGGRRLGLYSSFVFFLCVFGNTFFMARAFRIRADVLAALFVMLGIFALLRFLQSKRLQVWKNPWFYLASLGFFMAPLVTLKASLWIFFIELSLFALFFTSGSKDTLRRFFIPHVITMVTLVVLLAAFFLFAFDLNFSQEIAKIAFSYFTSTFEGPPGRTYFSGASFVYVVRLVKENPEVFLFPVVFVISWYTRGSARSFSAEAKLRMGLLFASTLYLIFYHEKYPFFVACFVPFAIGLSWGALDERIRNLKQKKRHKETGRIALFILTLLPILLLIRAGQSFTKIVGDFHNHEQAQFFQEFMQYMNERPSLTYYDVVGFLPGRAPVMAYLGPNQKQANRTALRHVQQQYPDLIFDHARLSLAGLGFRAWLGRHYRPLGNGVFVKALPWIPEHDRPEFIPLAKKLGSTYEVSIQDWRAWAKAQGAEGNLWGLDRIEVYAWKRPFSQPLLIGDKFDKKRKRLLFSASFQSYHFSRKDIPNFSFPGHLRQLLDYERNFEGRE